MELSRLWYGSGFGKPFFKVLLFYFIVNQAAIAKMNSWDVGRCPVKQLAWGHYLITVKLLQACTSSESFHCPSNSITGSFPMGSGRKVPFSRYPEVLFVMAQIQEILSIFVLGASSIREVDDLTWLRCRRKKTLQKGDETFLVEKHSRGIMMKCLRNNDIASHFYLCNMLRKGVW